MVSSLEMQLEDIDRKKAEILGKIDESRARKKIKCEAEDCGKLHTIKNLTLVQTYWYVQPHGCTGGDFWRSGEMQFICPETKVINRIMISNYDVPWKDRDKYENNPEDQFSGNYRSLFKEIITDHPHDNPRSFLSMGKHNYERDGKKLETEELIDINARHVNNHYVDNNRKKFGLVEKRKKD